MSSGICEKSPHIIKKGGYYHLYCCSDLKALKESIKSCVDIWFHDLEEALD